MYDPSSSLLPSSSFPSHLGTKWPGGVMCIKPNVICDDVWYDVSEVCMVQGSMM